HRTRLPRPPQPAARKPAAGKRLNRRPLPPRLRPEAERTAFPKPGRGREVIELFASKTARCSRLAGRQNRSQALPPGAPSSPPAGISFDLHGNLSTVPFASKGRGTPPSRDTGFAGGPGGRPSTRKTARGARNCLTHPRRPLKSREDDEILAQAGRLPVGVRHLSPACYLASLHILSSVRP